MGGALMRRLMTAFLVACLSAVCAGSTSVAQSPLPPPPLTAPADLDGLFPAAAEVGDALGLEVEAMGIQVDMSQVWEGADIEPGALVARRLEGYRWPAGGTAGAADDAFAGVTIDIDQFQSPVDGARYGAEVSAAITDPLADFPTDLSADLVTAGSWASDQGFGGSTIVVQEGPFVVIVTAARTGVIEMETASETVTALVLARIRGAG
jgi:hypothetical protein